jgi:hypothetical protein
MNASVAPGWFAVLDHRLSVLVPHTGASIVVDLAVLQAFAGLGVFMARRAWMAALILGVSLSLTYWILGQDMGQFWSGTATDPNTAPLMILLAAAAVGCSPWREARGDRAGRSGHLGTRHALSCSADVGDVTIEANAAWTPRARPYAGRKTCKQSHPRK